MDPTRLRVGEGAVPVEASGQGRVEFEMMPDVALAQQSADKGPTASLAPSIARSTYRKYASRAIFGRRLAAGPFSPLWLNS